MAQASKYDKQFAIIKWILIAVVVAIPLLGLLIFGADIAAWRKNSAAESAFGAQFQEIFNTGNGIRVSTPKFETAAEPKSRRGKALWLNAKLMPRSNRIEHEFSIDPVHGRISDELRAEAPGDVQTLALVFTRTARNSSLQIVKTLTIQSGGSRTTMTGPALDYWVEIIDVCLVDMVKKKFLGMKTFRWEPSMEEVNRTGDHMPARKHEEVVQWYESLKAE